MSCDHNDNTDAGEQISAEGDPQIMQEASEDDLRGTPHAADNGCL